MQYTTPLNNIQCLKSSLNAYIKIWFYFNKLLRLTQFILEIFFYPNKTYVYSKTKSVSYLFCCQEGSTHLTLHTITANTVIKEQEPSTPPITAPYEVWTKKYSCCKCVSSVETFKCKS